MGKDQADQESAVTKCFINSYVHAGHNLFLLSAEDVWMVQKHMLISFKHHLFKNSAGKAPTISSIDPEVRNPSLIPHFNKNGWAIPK